MQRSNDFLIFLKRRKRLEGVKFYIDINSRKDDRLSGVADEDFLSRMCAAQGNINLNFYICKIACIQLHNSYSLIDRNMHDFFFVEQSKKSFCWLLGTAEKN